MQYRKPDQYYIDQYDRMTIDDCKKQHIHYWNLLNSLAADDQAKKAAIPNVMQMLMTFHCCLDWWERKKSTIEGWIREDERKDRLVKVNAPPSGIRCIVCGQTMECDDHIFDTEQNLLFLFVCTDPKHPKKLVDPSGKIVPRTEPKCPKCGYPVIVKNKRTKKKITTSTKCTICSYAEEDEFEISTDMEPPIDENERILYCFTDERGKQMAASWQGLINLGKLGEQIDAMERDKDLYEAIDQIKTLTVLQLESHLKKDLESNGFVKLHYENPEIGHYIIVPFSLQDSESREPRKSVLAVTKVLKRNLLHTNWRLVDPQYSVHCRLGIISGKLKAYETEEDLKKIAAEISQEKAKANPDKKA